MMTKEDIRYFIDLYKNDKKSFDLRYNMENAKSLKGMTEISYLKSSLDFVLKNINEFVLSVEDISIIQNMQNELEYILDNYIKQ